MSPITGPFQEIRNPKPHRVVGGAVTIQVDEVHVLGRIEHEQIVAHRRR